jgi:hypothetical protein
MTSTTSRRTIMIAAASVPAMAVLPAAAATPAFEQAADPIFAAIEAHQKASSEHDAAMTAISLYHESQEQAGASFQDVIEHPEFKKLERGGDRAGDAAHAAACEMVATVPTTAAGIKALVRVVQTDTSGFLGLYFLPDPDKDCEEAFYETLQTALERLPA